MNKSSITCLLTGSQHDWQTKTSLPRTFSLICTRISPSLNKETSASPCPTPRQSHISLTSAGFEFPANIFNSCTQMLPSRWMPVIRHGGERATLIYVLLLVNRGRPAAVPTVSGSPRPSSPGGDQGLRQRSEPPAPRQTPRRPSRRCRTIRLSARHARTAVPGSRAVRDTPVPSRERNRSRPAAASRATSPVVGPPRGGRTRGGAADQALFRPGPPEMLRDARKPRRLRSPGRGAPTAATAPPPIAAG